MIVADAGPIIAFARMGRFELLRQAVEEIVVPDAVYEELVVKGGDRPGVAEVRSGVGIRRQSLRNRQVLAYPLCSLAPGEHEAIFLAEEEGAALLVDERKAREAAQQRGIDVVGSLWALREAKQSGWLIAVRSIIEELLAIGYWMHPERVIRPFLQEMGELPPTPEPPQE